MTADATRPRLSRARWALLVFGLVPVAVACLLGVTLVTALLQRAQSFRYAEAVAAPASGVDVNLGNARVNVGPSTDGKVHLSAHGRYSGGKPTIGQSRAGGRLVVTGHCGSSWLRSCRLDLDMTLPPGLGLVVHDEEGSVTTHDLAGAVQLHTQDGGIQVSRDSGPLDLQTSNGSIEAVAISGATVDAHSENGALDLDFAGSPSTVDATTSNGRIDIRLPSSASYWVTTRTDNGSISSDIPSDRFARRAVNASTSNGSIHISPSDT